MKWPTMDEFAQMVADKAIDEVEYNGKTLREWIELISNTELGTNLAEVGTKERTVKGYPIDADLLMAKVDEQCGYERGDNMTYKEIYEKAANMLDRGKITLGDFNKMVEPLNSEVQSEITHEQAVEYLQSTGWMREHDLQMMLDGVHRLTAQPEPHWIPVEQALPEYGKAVLTVTQDETYEVNHVIDEECGEWFWEDNGKVIAWCELPEPYKGVTE